MKKFVLAPDSFKGTMSSLEICHLMAGEIRRIFPEAQILSVPIADGGEGTVDAFLTALGGEKKLLSVRGPYGETVPGFYGLLPDGTAVVEMAAAAGLPLTKGRREVEKASTFGVGQLMRDALEKGAKKIIVGLGGSATNDGGCGCACVMGAKFYDAAGRAFVPVGETLAKIAGMDLSQMHPLLKQCEIVTMCDIDNPLCGARGAASTYGPQKGANPDTVQKLDEGLLHLAKVIEKETGKRIENLPGAGAAGGMGGGMVAFFQSPLASGIETVLDTVRFDELLQNADAVFTGEGRMDFQSLMGKAILGIAGRTRKQNVPLIAVVGDIGGGIEKAYEEGVTAIFSINRIAAPFTTLRTRAREDLCATVADVLRLMKSRKDE